MALVDFAIDEIHGKLLIMLNVLVAATQHKKKLTGTVLQNVPITTTIDYNIFEMVDIFESLFKCFTY